MEQGALQTCRGKDIPGAEPFFSQRDALQAESSCTTVPR